MPNRVAVVTGAGRGIGEAIAQRLASDGFHVVVADRDLDTATGTAASIVDSGGSAEGLALDVSDRAAVHASFAEIAKRLGRIDAVVNNAMWIRYLPITEFDEGTVDGMLGVGVKASLWTLQAAVPVMRAQGGGAIVNISSPAAVRSIPGGAAYSIVKGGVSSLTMQAAGELGGSGIRVNAIVPGSVPTPGASAVVDEDGYKMRLGRTPIGRLGQPADIAKAVSFLLSEDAGFMTGHVMAVDGGFLVT
jgi:NAD(P)-dependent dehydrogenase (short-subunit alcohol dehydrogenase family)